MRRLIRYKHWKMVIKPVFTMGVMLLVCVSRSHCSDFDIRFGVIKIAERVGSTGLRFEFISEASRVPLLTIADGVFYGLEYKPTDERDYVVQIKAITPHQVISKSPDVLSINKISSGSELLLKPEHVKGTMVRPLPFDKGDAPGIYRLEIMLDGTLYKVIEYEAFVPEE